MAIKLSSRLPLLPLSSEDIRGIYDAVRRFPITGYPALDFRLLIITGLLESGFQSGTITPPNGESSALGYFQIIRSVRNNLSKRLGIRWDNSVRTQALFAAAGYSELASMLRRRAIPMFRFTNDPLSNFLFNVRFRYVVGTGTKYFGHRDALSFFRKLSRYYPYLASGDDNYSLKVSPYECPRSSSHFQQILNNTMKNKSNMIGSLPSFLPDGAKRHIYVMSPSFIKEFDALPDAVKQTFIRICNSFTDGYVFISSVLSSHTGKKRDSVSSPNHAEHKAIDFVPTPFPTPFFFDQEGKMRSPNFHWNQNLLDSLVREHRAIPYAASVLVEPDHIHIDSNHAPGVSVKLGDKSIYPNLSGCNPNIAIKRLIS